MVDIIFTGSDGQDFKGEAREVHACLPTNMAKASHKIQSSRNQSSWYLILLIPGWRFASRYRTLGNLVSHGFLC